MDLQADEHMQKTYAMANPKPAMSQPDWVRYFSREHNKIEFILAVMEDQCLSHHFMMRVELGCTKLLYNRFLEIKPLLHDEIRHGIFLVFRAKFAAAGKTTIKKIV